MRIENASLAGYIEKGYATKGETIAELARSLTIDEATLENTMKVYTELAKAGVDKEFGRKHMTKTLEAGPYYAIKVTPGIHHTMGGVKIDTKAHIISTEGTPIKGLYAAGEITGGVHGGNRIGGNAVADIVIFGRISGQTAVEELK
jgi:fumarate reductase flavoprotein subunit